MSATKHEKYLISLKYWLIGRKYFKAVEALEFAARHHTGTRADGITPELFHQLSISHYVRTLKNLRDMEASIILSLLHDVREDYDVSDADIRDRFGDTIAHSVFLLSKELDGVKKPTDEYYMSMRTDPYASIVKGSDRIHNHQSMPGVFSKTKQAKYILETETYIIPMLKAARRNFPDQEEAYQNIKHVLTSQIELLKLTLEDAK